MSSAILHRDLAPASYAMLAIATKMKQIVATCLPPIQNMLAQACQSSVVRDTVHLGKSLRLLSGADHILEAHCNLVGS